MFTIKVGSIELYHSESQIIESTCNGIISSLSVRGKAYQLQKNMTGDYLFMSRPVEFPVSQINSFSRKGCAPFFGIKTQFSVFFYHVLNNPVRY